MKSLRDMTEADFDEAHGVSSAIGHVVKTSPVEVKMYACVGYGDLLKVGTKLYARPDPRIAELEGLLREARYHVCEPGSEMDKRIEAALKEG